MAEDTSKEPDPLKAFEVIIQAEDRVGPFVARQVVMATEQGDALDTATDIFWEKHSMISCHIEFKDVHEVKTTEEQQVKYGEARGSYAGR